FQNSDLMFFISDHLRSLYRAASGTGRQAPSEITYVGIDDETFEAANCSQIQVERDPNLIVSVSAMAPWKGTETVISALSILRRNGIPARLKLIGPWPDARYERKIQQQIRELKLEPVVEIAGKVS